jgi:glucose/arabinose dehydrogenase
MLLVSRATLLAAALHLAALLGCAQQPKTTGTKPAQETSRPGHYLIKPEDLPKAEVVQPPPNFPRVIPKPENAKLTLPPSFQIETYAEGGFQRPRWAAQAPNGDVFVSDDRAGSLTILRDSNKDGKVDERFVFATGLMQPFGMAFWRDYLYVGNTNAVVRFKYAPGQTKAAGPPEKIADLPGTGYREHWTRNLIFSPDGSKLYVTVGSQSNVDVEADPMRAAISEFNPDGTGHRIYASGTRNPIGLAFAPGSRTLWAAVQERDLLGDDLVPDYVTAIKDGGFYGWPYAYSGPNEEPRRKGERPDLVKKTIVPDVLLQAHSAVLGLTFYTGRMFPAQYRGDAFIGLHGSWNRSKRTGYKIARIRFRNGRPIGGYEDFITGWMVGEDSRDVWGRPVGVLVLQDGSMLITDDGANKLWRVTYSAPR